MAYNHNVNRTKFVHRRRYGRSRVSMTSLVWRAVSAVGANVRQRQDYRRLQDLPDYLLDDVGLTRPQIRDELKR